MNNVRIQHRVLPDMVAQALADRDATLWVGPGLDGSDQAVATLRTLIALPWKMVLCEGSSAPLVNVLQAEEPEAGNLVRQRGFIHLVAADPEGIQLPPRALPVYLLNGRENPRTPEEGTLLGRQGKLRRRLNMIDQMRLAKPRIVVLVSNGTEQPLGDFLEQWNEEGFRSFVVLVSTAQADAEQIDSWLRESNAPSAVDHCSAPLAEVVEQLVSRIGATLPASRLVVRMRNVRGLTTELDVTNCDSIERPLLDSYELIQVKDLQLLQRDELTSEDLVGFFSQATASWRPYAAGLPWTREASAPKALLNALQAVAGAGPNENRLLTVISESGAGGSTLARMLAFEAAAAGYPTVVARPGLLKPEVLELSNFLYRAHLQAVAPKPVETSTVKQEASEENFETPFLIVFDVHHWEGQSAELRAFVTKFKEAGRPVVVLAVTSPFVPAELGRGLRAKQIASLTHELDLRQVLALGDHLNKSLRHLGRERSVNEWQRFWEKHRPEHITASLAHFWIALEFWLKGQLDLKESVQSWLYRSFQSADLPDDVRVLLLEIAALSVERQPLPEGLMPSASRHQLPYSELIERARLNVPALALVREGIGTQKMWALAHDLLGRYLLTSLFYDHAMLERLGLAEATDPVQLRLLLLRRVACRTEIALRPYRPLALDFAIKILKLDAGGNQEFIAEWRQVLDILAKMPSGVRETSRTFNHHVAVSLRRVANQEEFGASLDERRGLLERAIQHLEYALEQLPFSDGEESDLNLLNSLALAYQNLADVEREAGASAERLTLLRTKASEATRNALKEDPSNQFVLETTARNLIQNGELDPDQAAASATEALGCIYQAITLERSESRQIALTRLATRALRLLRAQGGGEQVKHLNGTGNPLGALAEAWLLLTDGIENLNDYDLTAMPNRNVSNALAVLENVPQKSNWMLLRFRYDLITAARPRDYATQLRLLDELEGTGYRMPLQVRLEHAILLHQENRHTEGNKKFHQLRQDYQRFDAFVEVPARLFWLRSGGEGPPRICDARVVENRGHRSVAKVHQLKDEIVPFVPQEFGLKSTASGMPFKCSVNFGRNGAFLKPPQFGPQG